MSVSITNSLSSTQTANTSLTVDSTKNVEPLAVRGLFYLIFLNKKKMFFFCVC
jgi:hypothetical protein